MNAVELGASAPSVPLRGPSVEKIPILDAIASVLALQKSALVPLMLPKLSW